jgi:hypothetical protein
VLADVEQRADVGMRQFGDRARLVLETSAQPGVAGRRPVQHFQGDDAVEADVAGAIDLAHAAGTEGFENLVRTEFAPGGKRGRANIERDAVCVQR